MRNSTNNNYKTLAEIFNEVIELRGLNLERLAELTAVPKRFLAALRDGDFRNLPPAPYVRGYLMKIAGVLDIDGNLLWRTYKKENLFRTSGPEDKLPINRFTSRPLNKKKIAVGIVLIFALSVLTWKFNDFLGILGTPDLKINAPSVDGLIVNNPSIKLSGKADARDKLTINNEEIMVGDDGNFEKEFALQPGINTIEFKVKRLLGKETRIVRQAIYQP
jgi:hypothetical protein